MIGIELRAAAGIALVACLLLIAHLLIGKGEAACHAEQAQLVAQATAAASATEATWRARLEQVTKDNDARTQSIAFAHAADLASLRNRPARRVYVPGPAASACDGGTGAGLSGPDAGFLEGEATRANVLRSALAKCQAWIASVKGPP